jgi:apolipoprotein N-acyltransferase
MQSVSVVGLHGLTLGAVIVFSAPVLLVLGGRGRLALGLALVLAAAHVGYGAWRLQTAETRFVDNVRLRVVQPNIPQTEKWDEAEADRIFDRLIRLTEMRGETPEAGEGTPAEAAAAVEGLSGESEGAPAAGIAAALPETPSRTLVIWPESAFPFLLTDRPDAIARLADVLQPGETLIAGAARVEYVPAGRPLVYNSVYVIDDNGEIRDARDKVHLVPFGEYLPFQAFLESLGFRQLAKLPGGFSAGPERRLVPLEGLPSFLPLICYEIIFQDEIKATDGAGFIVNVTNDAWYGATPGPYQHLRQAEISAVAFGLPLVRSANTGISVVSDGYGRVVEGLALGSAGVVASGLPQALPPTIFSRQGNVLFWYLFATTWALGWASVVRNARED